MPDEITLESVQAQLSAAQARIRELNDEAKGHRLNAQSARTEAETARTDIEAMRKTTGEAVTAAEKARDEALTSAKGVRRDAALQMAGRDAGLVRADVLKLIDTSAVTMDESGALVLPKGFWDDAKKASPFLFGQASTSSTATAPSKEPPAAKRASDMNDSELAELRKSLGITV